VRGGVELGPVVVLDEEEPIVRGDQAVKLPQIEKAALAVGGRATKVSG
jgi:hypothetical protein